MKITQELPKKSAIYRSQYLLDKVRHMSRFIELTKFRL